MPQVVHGGSLCPLGSLVAKRVPRGDASAVIEEQRPFWWKPNAEGLPISSRDLSECTVPRSPQNLALLPHPRLWPGRMCTQQCWGLQRDGMMQDHVPRAQKGAINGRQGGERLGTKAGICWHPRGAAAECQPAAMRGRVMRPPDPAVGLAEGTELPSEETQARSDGQQPGGFLPKVSQARVLHPTGLSAQELGACSRRYG